MLVEIWAFWYFVHFTIFPRKVAPARICFTFGNVYHFGEERNRFPSTKYDKFVKSNNLWWSSFSPSYHRPTGKGQMGKICVELFITAAAQRRRHELSIGFQRRKFLISLGRKLEAWTALKQLLWCGRLAEEQKSGVSSVLRGRYTE